MKEPHIQTMTNESATGEPEPEDAVQIFPECHRCERDRRGETDRGGNEPAMKPSAG